MNKCSITKARINGLTMIYLCLYTDPLFWEDLLFNQLALSLRTDKEAGELGLYLVSFRKLSALCFFGAYRSTQRCVIRTILKDLYMLGTCGCNSHCSAHCNCSSFDSSVSPSGLYSLGLCHDHCCEDGFPTAFHSVKSSLQRTAASDFSISLLPHFCWKAWIYFYLFYFLLSFSTVTYRLPSLSSL